MAQTVSLVSDRIGTCTQVITLDGMCDSATAAEAHECIRVALDAGRTEIIFDLRGVISIAPPVLSMLSRGAIEAKACKGRISIIRPHDRVWAQFEDGGLGRVFPTFAALGEMAQESRG